MSYEKTRMPTSGVVKVESAYRNFRDHTGVEIEEMSEEQKEFALWREAAMLGDWQHRQETEGDIK